MTEITDLNDTDSSNTSVSTYSVDGNIANMSTVDNVFQSVLGLLARTIGRTTIASAATTNLGSVPGNAPIVSGNAAITSLGTLKAGAVKHVTFTGTPTLTYNATSLILPTAANIVVAAGDTAVFVSEGSGNWRCVSYQRASGSSTRPVVFPSTSRNLWVNPDFSLSQENGNALGTSSGFFPADQIALYFLASTAAMSVQRVQVRSLANSLNQIEFKTTTAKASLGANDFVTLTQPIEGSSFAEAGFGTANAKPYAFRFQITAPAGTYHWHFANSAANRHCSVPFVVAGGEANTAVVKEVLVPADTGGTWLTADGVIGLTAELVLAAGTTLTGGTASTWGGTFYLAASANFNTLGSTANVVRLGDVGIKKDEAAAGYGAWAAGTDAVYRSDRYAWKISAGAGTTSSGILGTVNTVSVFSGPLIFPTEMAKVPSLIATAASTFSILYGNTTASPTASPVIADSSTKTARVNISHGAVANAQAGYLQINVGGSLLFNARLT